MAQDFWGSQTAQQTTANFQTLVNTLQNLVQAINGLTTVLTTTLAGIYDPNGTNG